VMILQFNNVRGIPRGRLNKPKAGRSPTCRLWTADAISHIPCRFHSIPMPRSAVAMKSSFQNGMVMAWHGNGMACVKQTRPHCVNQMGKSQSKHLAERNGRGTALDRYGICELACRCSPVITN
jgi:hypothetical protein